MPDLEWLEKLANRMLGIPFLQDGRDPDVGLDCMGFAIEFVKRGYDVLIDDPLQWMSSEQVRAGGSPVMEKYQSSWAAISPSRVVPGDILLFAYPGPAVDHIGVVLGDGQVIHCQNGYGVIRSSIAELRPRIRRALRHRSFPLE